MRSISVMLLVAAAALSASAQEAPPPRFHFGGFGSVVYGYSSHSDATFLDEAETDLFASERLTDNWSVFAEGFLQHVQDGHDVRSKKHVQIDLERLYAAYNPSDRLRVEIGQIHTGVVRWTAREHLGRFLQTPIDVPSIANREEQDGAWPLYFAGVWASGRIPGSLGVQYGAGVGEARGAERDELQPILDPESSASGLLTLSIAPDALTGLEAGASIYRGRIPAHEGAMREVDSTFFASFVRDGIELRGEWAMMHHHRMVDAARFTSRGWYLLASARPRGRWRAFRPYVMIDHLDMASGEAYFSDVHDQNSRAAGVRWDLSKSVAVKGEVRSHLVPSGGRDHEFRAQLVFAF